MSATDSSPAGYYVSFVTSEALRRTGETLVKEVEKGNWKQQHLLIEVIRLFDQEAGKAVVLDGIAAMGLTGGAERFVGSVLSTVSATTEKVSKQVIPKLNEKQMIIAADHVRTLSLYSTDANGNKEPRTGFMVDPEIEQLRLTMTREVRAGNWQGQRDNAAKLLSGVGDALLAEVYLKSIKAMGLGFFADKIIQGGAGVARMLQHKLIDWAIGTLDEEQFNRAVDFMETRTLHLPEPLPHHYFYYPGE
ncbi:MAG: hypothetical protein REI12_03505 [Pedobacter sp.]|nr:hypothetical protein [Pedobacter sp.]